jgi:hypothetical protein
MMQANPPGRGSIFVAIAVTAFATGPCMLAILTMAEILFRPGLPFVGRMTLDQVPGILGFFTVAALVGSIPAACLNAYLLNGAAASERDAIWYAPLSGAFAGAIVLILLAMLLGIPFFEQPSVRSITLALFTATGACMGALHWLIAIRPRRKWRQRLMYDIDAIRAME